MVQGGKARIQKAHAAVSLHKLVRSFLNASDGVHNFYERPYSTVGIKLNQRSLPLTILLDSYKMQNARINFNLKYIF